MKPSEYFRDKVARYLTALSDRALEAGTDVVATIIALDTATPYTAKDYQNALTAWSQDRIDAYKSNPTGKALATTADHAIHERTPHSQSEYDDIVERAFRLAVDETLIENELEKRRNNGK